MRLAVGACHGDRPVPKAWSCHILNLSHYLDWSLWLLRWRVWGRGRGSSLLTRQARIHLTRWRWRSKATSTRGSHWSVIGGGRSRHTLADGFSFYLDKYAPLWHVANISSSIMFSRGQAYHEMSMQCSFIIQTKSIIADRRDIPQIWSNIYHL